MPDANQIRDTCKLAPVDVHSLTAMEKVLKHTLFGYDVGVPRSLRLYSTHGTPSFMHPLWLQKGIWAVSRPYLTPICVK